MTTDATMTPPTDARHRTAVFCNLLGQDLRETCREYAQMQREGGVFRGTMAVAAGAKAPTKAKP